MTTKTKPSLVNTDEYYTTRPATDKQIGFITSLLKELGDFSHAHLEEARAIYMRYQGQAAEGGFTMALASQAITELKDRVQAERNRRRASIEWPEVPTGRYAYQRSDDPEDIAFFHVVVTKAGFPLLWTYTPLEEFPIKAVPQKMAVLSKIADLGTFECELLFGQKIGICSRCGTELTNPDSRAYGMGPICRNK